MTEILDSTIKVFETNNSIPKAFLSECISNIVRVGPEVSHLASEFSHYLKTVEDVILGTDKGIINEWITIGYMICKNV